MSIPAASGIERINVIIFGLKHATLIPYVLYIAKNVADQNELDKMYGILESYLMRRMIVHASTKYYNNLFTSFILNKILTAEALLERLNSYREERRIPYIKARESSVKRNNLLN